MQALATHISTLHPCLRSAVQESTQAPTATGMQQDSAQTAKQPADTSASAQARQARAESARRLARELQEVLRHATTALLRLSQPEAISGLQTFCTTMFGPAYQLAAAATHADSKTHKGSAHSPHDSGSNSNAATRVGHSGSQFEWMQAVALQASVHYGCHPCHPLQTHLSAAVLQVSWPNCTIFAMFIIKTHSYSCVTAGQPCALLACCCI